MSFLTPNFADLLNPAEAPCLSLYQPTHRFRPENQQDPIRFKNLVKDLDASLRQGYPAADVSEILQPLEALGADGDFWNHASDGMAVFRSPGLFEVFRVQRPVPELAVVADSFHVKPLRRVLQTAGRYQILALTRHSVRLYEGNRDVLDEVELAPGVPRSVRETLGEETTEDVGSPAYAGQPVEGPTERRGQGGVAKREVDGLAERFFRMVDPAIREHHSKTSRLPLILAALADYHTMFRKLSQNPFLMEGGIAVDPEGVNANELRERAWAIVESQLRAELTALKEAFGEGRAKGLGSDQIGQVAEAAALGRVGTLFLEEDRIMPGRVDWTTGRVESGELGNPRFDDILDDLGELVESKGGRVLVVPTEEMPATTGLAAIYRY
ncbi:MAG: hypothetical protein RBU21_11340 [FCB group bacterium]|jgi:hypothetical protein|nr:hypothetical protein [FCB group bacterium]